jgi:uncharacterized protein (DUF58 family)
MPSPAGRDVRFIDPAVLARLGTMELRARTVVEGFLTGLHRSPFRGFSVEFAEYRPYIHGDDLSTLDWKIFARSDRHYVRKYEEDTNLECLLLLDISASMAYRGGAPLSKLDYASVLAASLAFLMSRQRDAAGLITFDDRIVSRLAPSSRPSHLHALLHALERVPPGRTSDLVRPLEQLAQALTRRGLIVVLSDLLHDPDPVIAGLRRVVARGSDAIVFQVLDPHEITFPFTRAARFRDVETDAAVVARPREVREDYLAALDGLRQRYRKGLAQAGIDFVPLDSSEPLDFALLRYLSARSRRG